MRLQFAASSSALVLALSVLACGGSFSIGGTPTSIPSTDTPAAATDSPASAQPATSSFNGENYVAFSDPDHLFSAQVPADWKSSVNSDDPHAWKWAWVPADQSGGIVFIEYDDGKTIPAADLGRKAEAILDDFFKQSDTINITEQNQQTDGSLQLSWGLTKSKTDGTTYAYQRGSTILVLSTLFDEAKFDAYAPMFSYIASTYKVP